MNTIDTFAEGLLVRLAWTSLQATLLIGAVWLLGRCMPRLSPAIRCMLWWLLSVQLIVGLTVGTPVRLPLLAPAVHTITATDRSMAFPMGSAAAMTPTANDVAATVPTVSHASAARALDWRSLALMAWLAGLLVQLLLIARQWRDARAVMRASMPLQDSALRALCMHQADALGLRRCPQLRVSSAITSPQVSGLWRPLVLLPAGHRLTPGEISMALTHELTHLRRGDLWLGWPPAIAQRLFFFHPLVAWAMREYALNREAACDAQVIRQHRAAPQDYGRLLLRLGVAHPMHAGLAGASPTFQNLKRRLTMLHSNDISPRQHGRGWLLVALVALAGVLPYRVTAGNLDQMSATSPDGNMAATPRLPPLPPAPPLPATPPLPPASADLGGLSARHVDISTHANANDGFALFDGDTITINGSDQDVNTLKALHKTSGDPLLWFRHGQSAYAVRDRAVIEKAKSIYAPVTALTQQQGRLAGEQGLLAGQQSALAAREAAFAPEQAALAQRQAQLAEQEALGNNSPDQRALDAERRGLDAAQASMEQRHAALEQELVPQQHALEAQQAKLEKQQQALEQRQQEALRHAGQAISSLLGDALGKGLAQDVSQR